MWVEGNQNRPKSKFRSNEELYSLSGFLDEKEAKTSLYEFLRNNLHFTSRLFGVQLFPLQSMAIKTMFETDYTLHVWARGLSKCISSDSLVLTSEGFKKAIDVKAGEYILSKDKMNLVEDKVVNPIDTTYKVTTKNGFVSEGLDYHRVLTLDSNLKTSYKFAKDLKKGDCLLMRKGGVFPKQENIFKENPLYAKRANIKSWYYFLGILFDNVVKESVGKFYFILDKQQSKHMICFCDDFLNSVGVGYRVVKSNEEKYVITIYDSDLLNFFEELGIFGKSLPQKILCCSKSNCSHFLSGVFDSRCDFTTINGEFISIEVSNYNFLKLCRFMLLSLGVETKSRTNTLSIVKKERIRRFTKHVGSKIDFLQQKLENSFGVCGPGGPKGSSMVNRVLNKNLFLDYVENVEVSRSVTVDLQVRDEKCYVSDGFINHNSFTGGKFAFLDAVLNQGVKTGILSASFRQSKSLFSKIEDMAAGRNSGLMRQCITKVVKGADQWTMEIGRSKIYALPLGAGGEKLRGFRFNRLIIDEFLLMPADIVNSVILPFLSSPQDVTERQNTYDLETKLIKQGVMKEEDRKVWPNNKMIALSSASHKCEYLYEYYQKLEKLILKESPDKNAPTNAIFKLSYQCAKEQQYDWSLVTQGKETMSQSHFDREFNSIFTDDSSGYFKVSKMNECTVKDGEMPCVEIQGEPGSEYILAFDPSWALTDSSDDFAIQIFKLGIEAETCTLVHSYAVSGCPLKDHIKYFSYCITNFNIVAIVGDYMGGVTFIQSCNESDVFKNRDVHLKTIDIPFEKGEAYQQDLLTYKNTYNREDNRIVILRKPTSNWIRQANELLQASFDHKKVLFGSRASGDDFNRQRAKSIDIDSIEFLRKKDRETNQSAEAKLVDFIDIQSDRILDTKSQCAMIQITTTNQGTQTFDLPSNLRSQSGPNKARKDSYSAMVLGTWMTKIWFDSKKEKKSDVIQTFTPRFI